MEKCYLSNFVEGVLLCIPCKFGPNPPKNNLRIDPPILKKPWERTLKNHSSITVNYMENL